MSLYRVGLLFSRKYNPILVTSIVRQHLLSSHNKTIQALSSCSDTGGCIKRFSTTPLYFKDKDRGKSKKRTQASTKKIDISELETVLDLPELLQEFNNVLDHLKQDFVNFVSVRTTSGSLENITIKFKNGKYKVHEIARVSRKPKEVVLDLSTTPEAIPCVLEVLRSSEMRLNPTIDGHTVYVPIPKVTKEYRENLSKSAKGFFDKHSRRIKSIRDSHLRTINELDKIPVDQKRRLEANLDLLCKQYIQKAEDLLDTKRQELLSSTN